MWRSLLAIVIVGGGSHIAYADCATHVDENDTQKNIQDKMDCLVKENKALRDKTSEVHFPIIVKLFTVHDPQELLRVKTNLYSWVTRHQGTIVNGTGIDKPSIAGYAGAISVVVVCADDVGICVVAGAGPIGQETNDAVQAIHSS
jgi:hypothetical protein